jgi:hypothetical protein
MGYMGGYTGEGACCDSAGMPMEMAPGTTMTLPQGTITPSPGGDQ